MQFLFSLKACKCTCTIYSTLELYVRSGKFASLKTLYNSSVCNKSPGTTLQCALSLNATYRKAAVFEQSFMIAGVPNRTLSGTSYFYLNEEGTQV